MTGGKNAAESYGAWLPEATVDLASATAIEPPHPRLKVDR
jgi:hypothetical protein